jgi:hypothetical protein
MDPGPTSNSAADGNDIPGGRELAAGRTPGVPSTPRVQRMKDRRLRALTRFLDRLRNDSQLRRKVFLGATVTAVAVVTLITVILTVLALTSSADTADRLAAAGDVLVGATLLLAAVAALVALLAYAVSTGAPDIQLSVQFDRSTPNDPAFEADIQDDGALRTKISTLNIGKVLLRNNSGYSAKNPAVIVRLHGMFFSPDDPASFEKEWASMELADYEVQFFPQSHLLTVVQWDGGPTYSIHGHSIRRLPDLQFTNLWQIPDWGKPALTFEILAEGYRKEIPLPVDFIVDGKSLFPREDTKTNPEWI